MSDKVTHVLPYDKASDWPMIVTHHLRQAYKDWGKDVLFQIKPNEETRSVKQNRLVWLLNGELAKHIHETQGGVFSSEEVHEFIVNKLLPKRALQCPDGEPIIMRTSTKELTVKDFAAFLDKYYAYASSELGCNLPMPDDLYWDALMREHGQVDNGSSM